MESFEAFYEVADTIQTALPSRDLLNSLKTGQVMKWVCDRPQDIGDVYILAGCETKTAVFRLKDNMIVASIVVDGIRAYQACTKDEFLSLFMQDHKLVDQHMLQMNLRSFERAIISSTRQARGKLFAAKNNSPVVVQHKPKPQPKETFFTIRLRDVCVGMTLGVSIVALAVQLAAWTLNS